MSVQAYLGDGVYASFDGHYVWLTADDEGRTHSVALEASVLAELMRFVEAVKRGDVAPTDAPR